MPRQLSRQLYVSQQSTQAYLWAVLLINTLGATRDDQLISEPRTTWKFQSEVQPDVVLDDARRINQVLVRGHYGSKAERYWSVLRADINDLARCYGLTPLAA